MLAALLSLAVLAAPQQPMPQLPEIPQGATSMVLGNGANLVRYVDFHQDLDRPGMCVVVGQLDKIKEGRRERLKTGTPAGNGLVQAVTSGVQYFKVPAKATVQARATFAGTGKGKVEFECDLQVARNADGVERYQSITPQNAPLAAGTMALFVLVPPAPGKKLQLVHVIPFDARLDTGASPEGRFVDTMHDFVAINRRVRDLEHGIAAVTGAVDDAAKDLAKKALTDLLAATVDLHQPEQKPVQVAQCGPFEARARELLAPPPVEGEAKK